jgi:hypothetical protein
MILNKEGGLKTGSLNSVQTGMMTGNRIPGLLELRIKEVDFQVELHYDISGQRLLSHVWKGGGVSISAFCQILFQVADALHRSPQYMLDMRQFILHEDYIFISGSGSRETVSLTYVPLQDVLYDGQAGSQFKQLVIRLMTRVVHLQGDSVQRMLELCDRNEFDPGALKDLLLQGMTVGADSVQDQRMEGRGRAGGVPMVAQGERDELQPKGAYGESFPSRGNSLSSNSSPRNHAGHEGVREQGDGPKFFASRDQKRQKKMHEDQDTLQEILELKRMNRLKQPMNPQEKDEIDEALENTESALQKYKTYIALACLLASAIVWRYIYLDHPEAVPLVISVVLTLVLAVIAYMSWTGKWGRKGTSSHAYANQVPVLDSEWFGAASAVQRKSDRYQVDKLTGFVAGRQRQDKRPSDPDGQGQESWRWAFPDPEPDSTGRQAAEESRHAPVSHGLHDPLGRGSDQASNLEASDTSEAYYKSLSGVTELLNTASRQETVLLHTDQAIHIPLVQRSPAACLERKPPGSGTSERIRLEPDPFVAGSFFIGREPRLVQFVEHTEGTSRSHIELSIDPVRQGHIVKDLSSTNGTVLNGEPMVPYKEYALKDGDIFKIAGVAYTYRLEDSFSSSSASSSEG